MAKRLLIQWTGTAPKEAVVDHRRQVSCAAVFPSKAAFRRATNSPVSRDPWFSFTDLDKREARGLSNDNWGNEGADLAIKNPGVVYYQDDLRNPKRDAPWLVHPTPDTA
jgi:hypothetical protein